MGDWQKFSRKSNVDLVNQVSLSVYVTNFPESFTSIELRKACAQYGSVVDVFIPSRKSKAGKPFGFVKFIKVDNLDRLVANFCTIWIWRHRLHANTTKYFRGDQLVFLVSRNSLLSSRIF